MNILAVYDIKNKFDRYTIVFDKKEKNGLNLCLGLSDNPDSALGFSQFSSCLIGNHLGEQIELPTHLKNHVEWRIK